MYKSAIKSILLVKIVVFSGWLFVVKKKTFKFANVK